MFESLSDRLSGAFRALGGRTRLTEENIRDGLREVRLALLEADVNFKVVKLFVDRVRERTLGQAVEKSLTPSQQLVKAVHDELVQLLGGETASLDPRGGASSDGLGAIMLVDCRDRARRLQPENSPIFCDARKCVPIWSRRTCTGQRPSNNCARWPNSLISPVSPPRRT